MTAPLEHGYGTAMAAIWSPKRIVVAAREKRTEAGQGGEVYFTLSGLIRCATTGFDAATIIRESVAMDNIAQILRAIEDPLRDAVQHLHDNDAAGFKEHLSGKNAADVFLFYKKGDSTYLSHLSFKTKKRGKDVILDPLQRNYPNRDTDIHSLVLVAAGVDPALEKNFVTKTPQQQALVYPQEALKNFMALAGATQPVHLLELGTGGVREG